MRRKFLEILATKPSSCNRSMNIKVKFFAMCREAAGTDECVLDLPDQASLEEFWKKIIERYPKLAAYRAHSRIAVNMEYAGAGQMLHNGDEICIIPPVSGG